jgi:hypothetical protein
LGECSWSWHYRPKLESVISAPKTKLIEIEFRQSKTLNAMIPSLNFYL